MISERVKEALSQDLAAAVRQAESLGLLVMASNERGRIEPGDLIVASADEPASVPLVELGPPQKRAVGPRKKAAAAARDDVTGSGAIGTGEKCDVCDVALPTGGRAKNRKYALCSKHAGRWHAYLKFNKEKACPYGAWVEHQKSGGGRIAKDVAEKKS